MVISKNIICAEKLKDGPFTWNDDFRIRNMIYEIYLDYTDYHKSIFEMSFGRYDLETLARKMLTHISICTPISECYRLINTCVNEIHDHCNNHYNLRAMMYDSEINLEAESYERINTILSNLEVGNVPFVYSTNSMYFVPGYLKTYRNCSYAMADHVLNRKLGNCSLIETLKCSYRLYKHLLHETIEVDIINDKNPLLDRTHARKLYRELRDNIKTDFGYILGTTKRISPRAEALIHSYGSNVSNAYIDKEIDQIKFWRHLPY